MKLCVCCKNVDFEEGYCYSTLTMEEASVSCSKNPEYSPSFNQDDFLKWNKYAEECRYYDPCI